MALLEEVVIYGTTGESKDEDIRRVRKLFGETQVFLWVDLNPNQIDFQIIKILPNTYTDEVHGKIYVIAPKNYGIKGIWPEKGREDVKYCNAEVKKNRDGDYSGKHLEKVWINALMIRQGNDYLYILINPANFHFDSLRTGWMGI